MLALAATIINVAGTTPTDHNVKTAREVEQAVLSRRFSWGQARLTIIYGSTTWPDHNNRRCSDLMVSDAKNQATGATLTRDQQNDLGDYIAAYLKDNAVRLGVNGLIWNHRCMGFPHAPNPPWHGPYGQWRTYEPGEKPGGNPHTDHVHLEVDTSAYKEPAAVTTTKAWHGTIYLTKPTAAYNKHGKKIKTLPAGTKLTGYVDKTRFPDDGRYFRIFKIPHRLWVPIGNRNITHTPPKK